MEDETHFKQLGELHFLDLFKDDGNKSIVDQLKVINIFPSYVQEEEVGIFLSEITLSEVEEALKGFKKDKSPGPDGWSVEFFLWFFNLVGLELLRVVEQSRIEGEVINSINATFITLIPTCEKPLTFADFRPISLYNLIYKLISKIAAIRLKPFLEKAISAQ